MCLYLYIMFYFFLEYTSYFLKKLMENCSIELGKLRETESGMTYRFEYNIPFYDVQTDIIILELQQGGSFPRPLKLLTEDPINEVHLLGYPSKHGKQMIFDTRCRLLNSNDAITKAESDIDEAISYWKESGRVPKRMHKDVEGQYRRLGLRRQKQSVLFHYSNSTTHGAAGSPGLTELQSDEGPVVGLVYHQGCQKFAYQLGLSLDSVPSHYLFERAIPTVEILNIINREISKDESNTKGLKTLKSDIFFNWLKYRLMHVLSFEAAIKSYRICKWSFTHYFFIQCNY